jgi:AcrR family transcriptional regulator
MVKKLDPQKHSDQRRRLLSHARRLFAAQGVKETSMSQIARACRVTKATLYHYFKSKEAVLKEILGCRKDGLEALRARLKQARDLEGCFYALGKSHLAEMEERENLELMEILLSETLKNSDMKEYYRALTRENLERGVREVLGPFLKGRRPDRELRLLFFQFLATLLHYTWHVKMVGGISGIIGNDEAFLRRLSKTYALAAK